MKRVYKDEKTLLKTINNLKEVEIKELVQIQSIKDWLFSIFHVDKILIFLKIERNRKNNIKPKKLALFRSVKFVLLKSYKTYAFESLVLEEKKFWNGYFIKKQNGRQIWNKN